MNYLLFVSAVIVGFSSGISAQEYNPKFDESPNLAEFMKAVSEDSAIQTCVPLPQIEFELAKMTLIKTEVPYALRKMFPKAGAGYFYGPYPPRIQNSVVYQNGQVFVPHLQEQENPVAYTLLAQWGTIDTTRGELINDANGLDPRDQGLYAESKQLDQNAAVLNKERDTINAEVAQYNQQCAGHASTPQCAAWASDLSKRISSLKQRLADHNAKVDKWRAQKKEFDGAVGTFVDKVNSWEKYINDFISKAAAFLSNPGNCTKEEHYQLQQAVNEACSPALITACKKGQDCDVLKESLRKFKACIAARIAINDKCYDGGDAGHLEQVAIMTNGADNCIEILKEDCGGDEGRVSYEKEGFRRVVFETAN